MFPKLWKGLKKIWQRKDLETVSIKSKTLYVVVDPADPQFFIDNAYETYYHAERERKFASEVFRRPHVLTKVVVTQKVEGDTYVTR